MPTVPPRKPTGHGGWRPGAGRPRKPGAISHLARPSFTTSSRVRVTLRLAPGVRSLRSGPAARAVREAIAGAATDGFRVLEHDARAGELELVVEAADTRALSRGMQSLSIRIARRANAVFDRRGALWASRYQAQIIGKR